MLNVQVQKQSSWINTARDACVLLGFRITLFCPKWIRYIYLILATTLQKLSSSTIPGVNRRVSIFDGCPPTSKKKRPGRVLAPDRHAFPHTCIQAIYLVFASTQRNNQSCSRCTYISVFGFCPTLLRGGHHHIK